MAQSRPPELPFPDAFRLSFKFSHILMGIAGLLFLLGVFTSFYQVPANSVGVVQRFGAYLDTTPPGLNFKIPFGVDEVTLVEIRRQLKLEFGYGTQGASNEFQYADDRYEQEMEKNMVT
eukprot:gene11661-14247_t